MSTRRTASRKKAAGTKGVLLPEDLNGIKLSQLPLRNPNDESFTEFIGEISKKFQMYCTSNNVSALINVLKVMAQRDNELTVQVTRDVIIFGVPERDQATMDISAVFYRTAFDIFYIDIDDSMIEEEGDMPGFEYVVRSKAVSEVCNSFETKAGENILTMCVSRDTSTEESKFVIHNLNKGTKIKTQYTIPMTSKGPSIVRNFEKMRETDPSRYSLAMTMNVAKHVLVKMVRDKKTPFALVFTPDTVRLHGTRLTEWMIEIGIDSHPQCAYRSVGADRVIIKDVSMSDIIPHKKLTEVVRSIWISEPQLEGDDDGFDTNALETSKKSKVRCVYNLIGRQGFVVYEQWS